ncbi:MAG: porin family protein [Mucilaginibacter sp.]
MKKYLLSLVIMVAVSISAKAQFDLGIKGGVNFSNIDANQLNKSTKTGYQVGAFLRVGSAFYLQPEVYLGSSGGNFNSTSNNTDYSASVRFTTLNVPLLLGHEFGSTSTNFRLMVGPVYSYLLSKNESFSQNFTDAYHDFGNYKNSTLGYQVGAGVDIMGITADLRYEGGLSRLNENYGQRANIWSISVGFKIL